MRRIHVYYSGRVQGVGFRFTARSIAHRLNLTGWIKNLPNGKVEAVCEGTEDELKEFLKLIKDRMDNYISDEDISWMLAIGEFSGFRIVYF